MAGYLRTDEWERWVDEDRAWKGRMDGHLREQGERIAKLEATKAHAADAAQSAFDASHSSASARKWTIAGYTLAAVINGILVYLGWGHSGQ